jgi:prolyl-tRNA editing enzyme YbaK/EbsC (Cys-tRNA(Pro) deacylase)
MPRTCPRAAQAPSVLRSRVRVAAPDEVLDITGFEPGAVAPFPAPHVRAVYLDRQLLQHELVWAGAGSPKHVVGLSPVDVARVTRAIPVDLAES